jgi:hypothetical protein
MHADISLPIIVASKVVLALCVTLCGVMEISETQISNMIAWN